MNIKILDSWLHEYLETKAKPKEIAEKLSLTSVSIERIEEYKGDHLYDIEVTTNRSDLMSVVGLAREASAVLPQSGIEASFTPPSLKKPSAIKPKVSIEIKNDPTLVNRVCAVALEVTVKPSPAIIVDRLESSDIRYLNNVIDVTNYVMRTIGHPTHVFDLDRLDTDTIIIRESKKGEKITTLDKKEHILPGGDIVATDKAGRIIDLLGIMGLENSVITQETKRILFFIDNNKATRMRKTSMSLALRSEAAQLNEKEIDPELAMDALLYGIELYKEIAEAEIISEIIDIYPNKPKQKTITVSEQKINTVIGQHIPLERAEKILTSLGFIVTIKGDILKATVPSFRLHDIDREEDLIEEIARVYGYHNLPSVLPPLDAHAIRSLGYNPFYWENRVKEAMKYWGFTETYTYSLVSEAIYEGPIESAVKLKNPLDEEHIYMRKTLIPSLLSVVHENRSRSEMQIFEIANTYEKKADDLPSETRMLAGIMKKPHADFYEARGLIEQVTTDLGITLLRFSPTTRGGVGADINIGRENIGSIEVLDEDLINFELNFEKLIKHASLKKTFMPLAKYPPIIEDLAFTVPEAVQTGDIIETIKKVSELIVTVTLLDKYQTTRTFHITYQDRQKNLTSEDAAKIRKKIQSTLKEKHRVELKT